MSGSPVELHGPNWSLSNTFEINGRGDPEVVEGWTVGRSGRASIGHMGLACYPHPSCVPSPILFPSLLSPVGTTGAVSYRDLPLPLHNPFRSPNPKAILSLSGGSPRAHCLPWAHSIRVIVMVDRCWPFQPMHRSPMRLNPSGLL